MAEKKKIYPNPKFENIEDEEKYWASHSPLDEGFSGEAQKEKQKRSSFLSIRLTGEELTQLRDLAAANGMGPSTFIRMLIKDVLPDKQHVIAVLYKNSGRFQLIAHKGRATEITGVKDKGAEQYRASKDAYCILKVADIPAVRTKCEGVIAASISSGLFDLALSDNCVKVISPGDKEFEKISRIARSEASPAKE